MLDVRARIYYEEHFCDIILNFDHLSRWEGMLFKVQVGGDVI